MIRLLRWTLLGLLLLALLLAAVAAVLPAQRVWRWLEPSLPDLKLYHLSGTLWKGSARDVRMLGQPLGRAEWTVSPLALLRGRMAAEVRITGAEIEGSSRLEAGRDGQIELRDLEARFPASRLGPALDLPALALLGQVELRFEEVQVFRGEVLRAEGALDWRQAALTGVARADLGEIRVSARTESPGRILGVVGNRGGEVAINGAFNLTGRNYLAEIRLAGRDPDNVEIREALQWTGMMQPDGSSLLRIEGTSLLTW